MKTERIVLLLRSCLLALIVLSVYSCTKWQSWSSIYDPNASYDTTGPVISGITPQDGMSGYREIVISGQNFPTSSDSVLIFFQSKTPTIKSLSPNRIVVYRPVMDASEYGATINVIVENPYVVQTVDTIHYQLEAPVAQFCDLHTEPYPLGVMEFDKDGYLYAAAAGNRLLFQITPDGAVWNRIMGQTQIPIDLAGITDMKFGPGGYLYCEVGTGDMYRIDVVSRARITSPFVSFPYSAGNLAKFDFDPSGRFYTSGDIGLFLADTNGNASPTGHYGGGVKIIELRVVNGFLYAAHGSILSKNVINADGSLGPDQLVVDVSTVPGLSGCTLSSFNIDETGVVYLAVYYSSQNRAGYSIFVVESPTSVAPFYYDEGMLPTPVDQILWSNNSRYLYLNRSFSLLQDSTGTGNYRLYRMGTLHNGAPYNGRGL